MEPRVSLITLGVADVARARAFYERLGFAASSASNAHVTFFQAGGMALGLFGWDELAADAMVDPARGGFRGVALAHNVRRKEEVAAVLAEAEAAGGRILKPAQDVFWGGHSGYFADLDGHLWEVAWNPGFAIAEDGALKLPE
jgi:catechol 2,3-dioxygenase-like lactoylglutathione lyase family enzyme